MEQDIHHFEWLVCTDHCVEPEKTELSDHGILEDDKGRSHFAFLEYSDQQREQVC